MIRKDFLAIAAIAGVLALTGCSSPSSASTDPGVSAPAASHAEPTATPAAKPAELAGEWIQEGAGDAYQAAKLTADTISIDWVDTKGGTTSVYWVGTYSAPSAPGDFTWTSTRDEAATDHALLASTDPTKDFAYAGGKISYQVTMMGVTKTVTLIRK